MPEFFADRLGTAIQMACSRRRENGEPLTNEWCQKGRFFVYAPPGFWGAYIPIFSQLGVVGPNSGTHRAEKFVEFKTQTQTSTFDVEITGGDHPIRTIGPGSARVTITGNVATTISIRCRSHSVPQQVVVTI